MRKWKSYSMAFAFFALCSVSMAGCDISGIVSDIVAGALGGDGGCVGDCAAGCGDCGSCGDCSSCNCDCACSGCEGCEVGCDPVLRDQGGRNMGFHGAGVHPGQRIGNSIQGRLTSSGFAFVQSQITPLLGSVLPPGGIDLGSAGVNGSLFIELRQFALNAQTGCAGNGLNGFGTNHDCARATFNAYFRTCDRTGTCTAGETVVVTVPDVPVLGTLTCNLNLDAGRGSFTNGLAIRADVATIPETAPANVRNNYGRPVLLDAEITNTNSLEGADVQVSCPNVPNSAALGAACALGFLVQGVSINCGSLCLGGSCSINPTGLVNSTISDLRGQLNAIVDTQVNDNMPALCYPAYHGPNGSETGGTNATAALDCPTGTTYAAPAMGAVSKANPGRCNINGSNPVRCMEILAGLEARVDMGGAVGVVTPGIEAVVDVLVALQGHIQTRNMGSNLNIYGGMEGWYAGIRALPHNPCVPIENPANNQGECDALGSGYVYEAIPNGAFTGRCVPRIPIVPEADLVRTNVPFDAAAGETADPRAGDGDYEAGGAVSTDFIQYAAWKLWDSGVMCLNVGSWLDPTLSPSLIALAMLAPETLPRLFFPLNVNPDTGGMPGLSNTRTVALMLKPQTAPQVTIDEVDDPCEPGVDTRIEIEALLEDLNIDLSIWNDERYGRVGTINTDVRAVIAIDHGPQAAANGCGAIDRGDLDIKLAVLEFTNAQMLPDAPMLTPLDFTPNFLGQLPIQTGLNSIGEIAGGIAAGLIPPVELETLINNAIAGAGASLGGADIPIRLRVDHDAMQIVSQPNAACSGAPWDTGVRTTDTNCTYDFLALYLDLCSSTDAACNAAGSTALMGAVDTAVEVTNVVLPTERAGFDLQGGHFAEGESPSVEIAMSATGPAGAEFEYAYRTTFTGWSEWQRSPYAVIRDRGLFVQGNVEVFAMARVAGESASADMSPAQADFRIDVTAPMVQVYADDGVAQVQALDLVSDELQFRTQDEDGEWSAWNALPATGVQELGDADEIAAVEVRDEDGNVASSTQSLQGRVNSSNSTACASCATAGAQSQTPPLAILGGLVALGAVVARRRRRA